MNLIQRFMRAFFNLLYHPFAFTYDLVAATVSFGRWKDWVYSILPFIEGTRILELGHGPGHLQRILLDRGLAAVAIDKSAPMGTLAKRRLGKSQRLARALAQKIPFASESFELGHLYLSIRIHLRHTNSIRGAPRPSKQRQVHRPVGGVAE